VNAGWPEAAMAGALDIRIAGPRVYNGIVVSDPWMGDGNPNLRTNDIDRALRLYFSSNVINALILALLLLI
jgi:adenosylcobinamide-phosphate synthase